MKRTARILFSAMLVLMFVFSFAGATPAARAEYIATGSIEAAFYLRQENTGTEPVNYQPYADTENPASADFGNDEGLAPSLADLQKNGVSVAVPKDLYVESVVLSVEEPDDDSKVLKLNEYAVLHLDAENGDTLTISPEVFADDGNGGCILNDLGESSAYVLSVYFAKIVPEAEIEVICTDGVLNGQLFADETLTPGENGYEVEPLSKELEETAIKSFYKEFAGWKLVFDSGISVNVNSGDTVSPLLSCKLVAQWKDVIVVQVNDASQTYNGTALKATYNVYGDSILESGETVSVVLDENGSITDAGSVTCSATAQVLDADGNAVEDYVIYIFPGTLTVNKAPVTIQSGSGEKVYDGQPLTVASPKITGSTFGEDSLTVEATGTLTDVGETVNTVSYDLTGNKDNYEITVTEGTLKVTARPLTVTTESNTADYTGTALTKDGYTVAGLAEGHTASVTVTGSQTIPGSSDNTADVVVKDAEGKDVTANYSVSKNLGKLTVNALSGDSRIALTIAPKEVKAGYDGTAHAASEYEIVSGKLPEGVTLTVTYSGERTDAGEGETSIGLVTFIQDKTDVTANFNLSTQTGKITVSPRPITITAESATKEYDTKALTKNTAKVTSGSLVSGHKVSAIEINGSQTEVGTSKNTIKEGSVKITDASGKDVTANYALTLKEGTLEVTGKAITDITVTAGASKVYDGTALTLSASDIKVTPALPSGYTITATFSASSRTDAGKDEITLTNIAIKDASNKDVTAKFNIKVEKGSLEVTKRPLTVTTGDKTKVYDGKALTDRTIPTVEGQVSGHNIELKFTGTQTKVGSSDNSVEVRSIKDKETKADVTANYEITYKFGKLTVTSATGTTSNNTKPTVNTGDTNNIWIWVLLMVAAAGAAVAVVIFVRKSRKNGDGQTK